jgi:hypothetical protein
MDRLYGRKDYWEDRYQLTCSSTDDVKGGKRKRGHRHGPAAAEEDVTSEWYLGWSDVAPLLEPHIKKLPKEAVLLDLGMGLSSLFADALTSLVSDSQVSVICCSLIPTTIILLSPDAGLQFPYSLETLASHSLHYSHSA